MIFVSLLIVGALVGLLARIAMRGSIEPVSSASLGSATAFVVGGLWVGAVNPTASALDPAAMATGTGSAVIASTVTNAVSTPYRRAPGRGNISRSDGIRRSSPAPRVQPLSSRRRSSGARHRAPDASSPKHET